jgi:hypothetical protein
MSGLKSSVEARVGIYLFVLIERYKLIFGDVRRGVIGDK